MNWLGTKRPSWVRNNWVRNNQGYEMTGNRLCFIITIIIIIIIVIIIITGSGLHQWIHKIHLFQSRLGKSVFITESNQVIRRFKGFIQFFRAQNWIFRPSEVSDVVLWRFCYPGFEQPIRACIQRFPLV